MGGKNYPRKKNLPEPPIDPSKSSNLPSIDPVSEQQPSEQSTNASPDDDAVDILEIKSKAPGKRGRDLGMIDVNYVKLSYTNAPEFIYHYDVSFEPDRPMKLLRLAFNQFVNEHYDGIIAFDGRKSAFALRPLRSDEVKEAEIMIIHPETGRDRRFKVIIQAAKNGKIPFKCEFTNYHKNRLIDDPKRATQALEIGLKEAFFQDTLKHGIVNDRSFFLSPGRLSSFDPYLGDFADIRIGLFQSVVLGKELYLNVDVSHKAFPKRYVNMIDMFKDLEKDMKLREKINLQEPLNKVVERKFLEHLRGLEICYTMPGSGIKSIRKFVELTPKATEAIFNSESGETMTVFKHFRDQGIRIEYLSLPCVKLGKKGVVVPMEFCSISENQVLNRRCTGNQTQEMINHAATSTTIRRNKIMDLLQQIKHNGSKTVQGFGINVEDKFISVPARQLQPPDLEYSDKRAIRPCNGEWRPFNLKFLEPGSATDWGVLNASAETNAYVLKTLVANLILYASRVGMQLHHKPSYMETVAGKYVPDSLLHRRIGEQLEVIGKQKKIKILFCIIPGNESTYAAIKKFAELQYDVLTQCIKSSTLKDRVGDPSTISNILQKVNMKLNGTNHRLKDSPVLKRNRCMIIGADVTHPSPDQKYIPSIVGVVTSYDRDAFRYNASMDFQKSGEEIIQNFKQIIKEQLLAFKKQNRYLPDKLIYFRDGVSEGLFNHVMSHEKKAMLQACNLVEIGYEKRVHLTIILVQKRHHTRFFPQQSTNIEGAEFDKKYNNVPPGTIVDVNITRPNENQFFLASHKSGQGVTKPTKYCVLQDDANFSMDEIEGLANDLCYMYGKTNRSVSYPTPTYYAHWVAKRGRSYIKDENLKTLDFERIRQKIKSDFFEKHRMFFI